MANQYKKVSLFIINESSLNTNDKLFNKNLSIAVIDVLKDTLPKDVKYLDLLIEKFNSEL